MQKEKQSKDGLVLFFFWSFIYDQTIEGYVNIDSYASTV